MQQKKTQEEEQDFYNLLMKERVTEKRMEIEAEKQSVKRQRQKDEMVEGQKECKRSRRGGKQEKKRKKGRKVVKSNKINREKEKSTKSTYAHEAIEFVKSIWK